MGSDTHSVKLAFEIELPDGVVDHVAEADLVRTVKEQTALRLYAEGRVTTSEAAGMLGQTRIQFLDLLRRSGVGFRVEIDDDDIAQLRRRRDELARDSGR